MRLAGRWLRRVNEVYKTAPYYPAADGFGADDVNLLSSSDSTWCGWGRPWPHADPGKIETAYIDKLAQTVNQLTKAGITPRSTSTRTVTPQIQRQRLSDWMAIDDGLPNPDLPFPSTTSATPPCSGPGITSGTTRRSTEGPARNT